MNTNIQIGFFGWHRTYRHHFVKATITAEELRKLLIENKGQRLICLKGLTVEGDLNLKDIEFAGQVSFQDAIFKGKVNFGDAIFEGGVHFGDAIFKGEVSFGFAVFNFGVYFEKATFEGKVNFGKAIFNLGVDFGDASIVAAAKSKPLKKCYILIFERIVKIKIPFLLFLLTDPSRIIIALHCVLCFMLIYVLWDIPFMQ